jgi:type I site-specific deoxyribonuclease, hsdR family
MDYLQNGIEVGKQRMATTKIPSMLSLIRFLKVCLKKNGFWISLKISFASRMRDSTIKDFYKNDELIAMTKALTETLRKNKTIDWSRKAGARAHMRMLIKRLLKKYDYPPAGVEDAVETVMSQCEVWTDNLMELDSSAVISSNTTVQKENVKAVQTTNSKTATIKNTLPSQSYTDASLAAETIPKYGSKP